jgi:hypothetical protein
MQIQEREQNFKPLFGNISKSGPSKAIPSSPEDHLRTQKDNIMVDTSPSLEQKADFDKTDKTSHGLKVSRFGAIKHGDFGSGFIKESNLLSLQKIHTGETPYMHTQWGQSFRRMSIFI